MITIHQVMIDREVTAGKIFKNIPRPGKESILALSKCEVSFVLDQLDKCGAMHSNLRPLKLGMHMCGPAITCLGPDRDLRRMAINLAKKGDIIVIAAEGQCERACFGGTTAKQMKFKGIEGIVIDGSTRDSIEIRKINFPTFVKGVTPLNYIYPINFMKGGVNIPVVCAGVCVVPGDVILGDSDGVIVIPREVADQHAKDIYKKFKEKVNNRQKIVSFRQFKVRPALKKRGYIFENGKRK